MTNNEQRTHFLEMLHGEIAAAADIYAESIHEGMTMAFNEKLQDAFADFADPDLSEQDIKNIVEPALRLKMHAAMARLNDEAALSWQLIFGNNLNESYPVEPVVTP